jgi:hypothetical protein
MAGILTEMTQMALLSNSTVAAMAVLLSVTSVAQAQDAPPTAERTPLNVSLSAAWVRDLTSENTLLPGAMVAVDIPIGRGQWVAIEGGFYRSQNYPVVRERSVDHIPRVTRYEASVAGRLGRSSGNGPFFQIGVGQVAQSVAVISDTRNTGRFERDELWIGPGLGVDVRASPRLAIRALAEVRWFAGFKPTSRLRAGLVYRFARR